MPYCLEKISFPCLPPSGYRQLRSMLVGLKFLATMRSASDESPEEWEGTQSYAVQCACHSELDKCNETRGCWVFMAFGTRFKLIYFPYFRENPPPVSSVSDNPYSARIAAIVTDPNPVNRVVPLIPGQGPFDISDEEPRTIFENWMKAFRGEGKQEVMEYDPITEKFLPLLGSRAMEEEEAMESP